MPRPNFDRLVRPVVIGVALGALAWLLSPQPSLDIAVAARPGGGMSVRTLRTLDLFDRTDQPLEVSAPAASTTPVLQGVSVARGRVRALVSFGGATAVWMKPGEVVNGWTFKGLEGQDVLLTSSTGQIALRPFSQNPTQ